MADASAGWRALNVTRGFKMTSLIQHPPSGSSVTAIDRITIRLRPDDASAIHDRAARRGFKPSAYIAALVRAHLTRPLDAIINAA